MAREIKVYSTIAVVPYWVLEHLREAGLSPYTRQAEVICGAHSFAEANRIAEAGGLGSRTFVKNYTRLTGNKASLQVAGKGGLFVSLDTAPYETTFYEIKDSKFVSEQTINWR